MKYRTVLIAGAVLAAGLGISGFVFFKAEEVLLNLTSEAIGIALGGLVVFALLETHGERSREADLRVTREGILRNLSWELERLQFSVRPMAGWTVGFTFGEEVRALVQNREQGPLPSAYFLELRDRLAAPLAVLSTEVIPRAFHVMEKMVPDLLELETCGRKVQAAGYSLSHASPAQLRFQDLINDLLNRSGIVGDAADRILYGEDAQAAAQARFDRLRPLGLSELWSTDNRVVRDSRGEAYKPGV